MRAYDDLTTDDWIRALSQSAALGCKIVQIVGGEPTLSRELIRIVAKSRELGYRYVVLFTNATLLTEDYLDQLSAYNVELVTSFYSHIKDVHDAITLRKGSFDRTIRGIQSVLDRGLPLEVSMVRMPQNADLVEDAIEFLVGLGIHREKIAVGPLRGVGRGALIRKEENPYSSLCGHCFEGHLVISSNGAVYPCIMARWLTVGNIKNESLQQVLANPQLLEFRDTVYNLAKDKENM